MPEGKIIALERDPDMIAVLRAELAGVDNVDIEAVDALRYDLRDGGAVARRFDHGVRQPAVSHRGAAAVPHHRAARELVTRAVVMIQKEMADRIVAPPGGKDYGALGVMLRTYVDVDDGREGQRGIVRRRRRRSTRR